MFSPRFELGTAVRNSWRKTEASTGVRVLIDSEGAKGSIDVNRDMFSSRAYSNDPARS